MVTGYSLDILSDNTTAVCYISQQGDTVLKSLCHFTIDLWDLCIIHSILPMVTHLLKLQINRGHAKQGRGPPCMSGNWSGLYLEPVFCLWSHPHTDIFTSRRNKVTHSAAGVRTQGPWRTNSFCQGPTGSSTCFWCCPDPQVLQKLQREKPTYIVIMPCWLYQALVPCDPSSLSGHLPSFLTGIRPAGLTASASSSSWWPQPQTDCLDGLPVTFSYRVSMVLINCHKPSTRKSYSYRLNCFLFAVGFHPTSSGLSTIFYFLLSLVDAGMGHSSIQVYLAAILALHDWVDGHSILAHPISEWFLKGLLHLHPLVKLHTPALDLPLVHRRLMRKPFELLATSELQLLTFKTAFLLAITLARRVSELTALYKDPLYLSFHPHSVTLNQDVTFLPRAVSEFHLNLEIILPDFFLDPVNDSNRLLHTLDVKKAMLF